MKNNNDLTRRHFLLSAGALSGTTFLRVSAASLGALAQAACSARDEARPFIVLSDTDAADVEAIAARIFPTTDTPGATEAGVVHFFDNALAAEMSNRLDTLRTGLAAFNAEIGRNFATLSPEQQDEHLRRIEGSPFFGLLWELTVFGFFAMSKYGGNRNHVAWDLIGFKGHNGGWQYPFGYYDADVHMESDSGQ